MPIIEEPAISSGHINPPRHAATTQAQGLQATHTVLPIPDQEPYRPPMTGIFSWIGPVCFGPANTSEKYPKNFKGPRVIKNYNASMDRRTWIDNYALAMEIQNANEFVAAWYLPLMLEGSTRSWINNLPTGSINSWEEMKTIFIRNFEGACK
jgi:hypothetical protein